MITMRLTGNRESWAAMQETMEVDVSDIFDGTSLDVAGQRLFDEILAICNGRMTKAEALREWNAFAINRCGPSV
jgi:altronate dehydratase large subunit